jgi:oxygen-dependent protoporphyrinogen oxidase
MVRRISPSLASRLESIYYPPVAEVFLGFRNEQIGRVLDGFGFLVPAKEQRRILGTIWSSSLFDGRAPVGHAALTTFVGGARQPELVALGDNDLRALVLEELGPLLSITGSPVFVSVTRWTRAIPQYNLGYHEVLTAIDEFENANPGVFLCSNFRGGIAVGDCIMSSERTASRILEHLGRRQQSAPPVAVTT